MNQVEILEGFKNDMVIQGYTPLTVKNKACSVREYLSYLDERQMSHRDVKVKDAQAYQGYLLSGNNKKYERITIRTRISDCCVLYEYLRRTGEVLSNPFAEIKNILYEKKIPDNILKEDEMHKFLLSLCDFETMTDYCRMRMRYRTHVIAELLYSTGLRIREAAALKREDIDFEKGIIYVEQGKGDLKREVMLNEYAGQILRIYIEEVRDFLLDRKTRDRQLIFGCSADVLGRTLNKELLLMSKKLGLKKQRSHSFRHALGFHLLRSGCDIRHIQAILGHRLIKNTEVYTKVEKEDLKNILDTYHPRRLR